MTGPVSSSPVPDLVISSEVEKSNHFSLSLHSFSRGCVGIGRQPRLRIWWRKPWGFESPHPYTRMSPALTAGFSRMFEGALPPTIPRRSYRSIFWTHTSIFGHFCSHRSTFWTYTSTLCRFKFLRKVNFCEYSDAKPRHFQDCRGLCYADKVLFTCQSPSGSACRSSARS